MRRDTLTAEELSPNGTRGLEVIDAFGHLLGLRDGYAGADAEAMVRLCSDVADRLGLAGEARRELDLAARLHDIGKIGVPDRILHKAGPLDAGERLIMQRHPVWGAEVLRKLPGMEGVAEAVRSHHERVDGHGYPAGLAGEEIPLASRIVGACETYRALTSERPYRRSLAPGQALRVVVAGAGTHFDPAVVDALAAVLADQGVRPDAAPARGDDEREAPSTIGYGRRLADAFERIEQLPALAESRDRLLSLLGAERPVADEVVATVESDVALVVAMLRLANRGGGGTRGAIATIPQAVAALTPGGVEMMASRIATVDFFERMPGWDELAEHVRAHAVAVQRTADRIAERLDWPARDELLVSSLLHDIGKLALALAHPGYPAKVHGRARTPLERVRAERHELGLDHAVVGGALLRRWRLPERLVAAVEDHHVPEARGEAAIIGLADLLAHFARGARIEPATLLRAAEAVGMDAATLRSLMYELPRGGAAKRRSAEPNPLTTRERDVLRLLAQGLVYKEIGVELGMSTSTVRTHLHHAYRRLGVADRAQAVLLCAERGWL